MLTRRTFVTAAAATAALGTAARAADPVKVAWVYIGPIGDHGWTYAHDQGRLDVEKAFGDKVVTTYVENVAEGPDAERVIRRLAADGNALIFTTSFGYMNPTLKVAQRTPDTFFEHATGYKTHGNMSAYNSRFYEGRAVCGTIAGHMSESGIGGYIASFPIPEVVMGINAFQLAAQKVNPDFQTRVIWVNTWYDPAKEADAAKALIDQGVDIITQHTDSPAALQAAEQRGLMAFGQAWDMASFAPKAHLTAIKDNWGPYYVDRVQAVMDGTWASQSTWWGMKEGAVEITPYNERVPADVVAAAEAVKAQILENTNSVFAGPLTDVDGTVRVAEGEMMDDGALLTMDWYVAGVQS
ncbi:MAG: BMP family ABC transporter substrate-binding protein [Pseudomonadota bacterium]